MRATGRILGILEEDQLHRLGVFRKMLKLAPSFRKRGPGGKLCPLENSGVGHHAAPGLVRLELYQRDPAQGQQRSPLAVHLMALDAGDALVSLNSALPRGELKGTGHGPQQEGGTLDA